MTALREPNTESAVITWLKSRMGAGWYVVAEGEEKTTHPVPAVLVNRTGGSGYNVDSDHLVELTVITPTRREMWGACSEAVAAMLDLVGNGTAMVDDVEVAGHFVPADPNPNPANRRATGLFRLTVRPQ